jgi:hypothetical protein
VATWPLGIKLSSRLGPLGQGFDSSWWLISFECPIACLGKSTMFVIHIKKKGYWGVVLGVIYHETAMPCCKTLCRSYMPEMRFIDM